MRRYFYLALCLLLLGGCTYFERVVDSFITIKGSWEYKNPSFGPTILTYNKDMTYELDIEGDGVPNITGTYHLFDNQLKLTDTSGEYDRKKCSQTGVYFYEITGKEVRYQLVADQCSYRIQALAVIWQRYKKKK